MPEKWNRGLPPRDCSGWFVLAGVVALLAAAIYVNVRI